MGENVSLRIVGTLDVAATKPIIDAKIAELESKINKLNLTIKIDDTVLKTLKDFSTQMEKIADVAKNTGKIIQESINPDGSKVKTTYYSGLKGEFSQIETAAKQAGQTQLKTLDDVRGGFSKVTSEAEKYNSELQKIAQTIKMTNSTGTQTRTVNMTGDGGVTGYTDTTNYAKEAQLNQQLIDGKEKLRQELVKLGQTGNVTASQLAEIAKAVNTSSDLAGLQSARQAYSQLADNAKLAEQMAQGRERASLSSQQAEDKLNTAQAQQINRNNELTRQLEQQISLYQRQAEMQATNLSNNSNKLLSTDQQASLQNYLTAVRELSTATPQVEQRMRELSQDFREISTQTVTASRSASTFGQTLKQAFNIMPLFTLVNSAIMSPINAMRDMVQQLIQIDTQMTEIKRVMDAPDYQFVQMLQDATDMSSQLSSKLTDVLSIMGDFGRMGFSATQLNDITKTAQVLQNISDLNASDSVDTLTSAMLNFNIASTDSISIADKLNEVNISSLPLQ